MSEIKQGYKQTDLGVIPEDWKILPIGEVFSSFPTASYSKDEMRGGKVKCIHYGDIHTKYNTIVSIAKDEIPAIEEYQAKRYIKLKNGDLIVADASEDYAGVGKCIEVDDCDDIDVISGLHTIPLRDKNNNYVNGFKGYAFQSKSIKSQLERQSVGTKVYSISYNSIKECLLTIPTPTEQQAIASVLSDIDSLISALDKKIAKKQALKQGAMQQLLTAKKRLPGFTEPWVEKRIGDIGLIVTGSTPSRSVYDYWGNEFAWISAVDFQNKYIYDSKQKLTELGKGTCRILPVNSVLVTCIASIGLNAITKVECATNQQINAIVCNDYFCNEFVYYIMQINKQKLLDIAGQTAVPIISKNEFELFSVYVTPNKEEQQAIAQILTDMDKEIEQLQEKRNKYTALKQGAMQKLLTGQIRIKY